MPSKWIRWLSSIWNPQKSQPQKMNHFQPTAENAINRRSLMLGIASYHTRVIKETRNVALQLRIVGYIPIDRHVNEFLFDASLLNTCHPQPPNGRLQMLWWPEFLRGKSELLSASATLGFAFSIRSKASDKKPTHGWTENDQTDHNQKRFHHSTWLAIDHRQTKCLRSPPVSDSI